MDDYDMPPASGAELMETRSVRLPPAMWQACEEIAAGNEKLSEVYRRVMAAGISAERERLAKDLEYRNKMLINRRLAAKEAGALQAVETLAAEIDNPDLIERLAQIHEWLGKG